MQDQTYARAVGERMRNGGYNVTTQELPGGVALVGYRADFRLAWFATRLHLFVAVAEVPSVSADSLRAFAGDALEFAKRTKGQFRGMQSGVGVIAALACPQSDEPAREFARRQLVRQFGAFAWPALVDLTNDTVYSHQGSPTIGRVYNRWMRTQIAELLPPPAH